MKKRFIHALLLPTLLFSNPFESTLKNEISWLQEETFVISASKVKENIKKTSASITVIDADMIEKMGATNIFDALRSIPGLGISQSNINVDKINIRGIQTRFSEKVLILLDGHSLNVDLLNGGATGAYKELPIELIQRIEVIKGPASALYGENAFTALINIITKKAKDINGEEIVVKYGANNTKKINMMFGNIYKKFTITANVNYISSDGESIYVKSDSVGNSGYTKPTLKSTNGYFSLIHTNGLYLKANYNTTEDGPRYGAMYALNDEDISKKIAYFVELGYEKKLSDILNIKTRIYFDSFQSNNFWELFPEGFPAPVYKNGMLARTNSTNEKSGLEALFTMKNDNYTLISGVSYELQELKDPQYKANYNPLTFSPLDSIQDFSDPSTNFTAKKKRTFWAVYSELLYDVRENIRITAGIRYDHYSDFKGVLNPRLGATWEVNKKNNIKIMYGEAFRAPTFAELYNTNNSTLLGNPNLNPETVKTLELSYQNNSIDNLKSVITVFNSTIKDIITTRNGVHVNEGKVSTHGLEIELKYKLNRGSYILANYTYQNPKSIDSKEVLSNISHNKAYFGLNKRLNQHFNLYIDANYKDKQTRMTSDTRKSVSSSIIANATLLVGNLLKNNLELKVSVYNIFDEKSYDSNDNTFANAVPYDYPLASRLYMTELKYRF